MIRERGALSCDQAIPLFAQILAAIDYAHRQGVIHRDIKPSNFIVQPNGGVKVTDFGVAKVFGGREELTRAGTVLGTSHYMSPEQILARPISVASDIYSLGITLYEMVTGRVPFSGNSDFEIQRGHLELPPPLPRLLRPSVPEDIEGTILRSIEKKPENRFPSVARFLDALSTFKGDEGPQKGKGHFKGKRSWPFPLSWKGGLRLGPWIDRFQNLPMVTKGMILLFAVLLVALFLIILFSTSSSVV